MMKAKLIKTIDGYELFTQGFLKGSTNHGLIDSLNIEEGSIRYKLSLKNCQAIELGYDLDELAEFYSTMTVFIKKNEIPTEKQIEDAEYISEIAFKAGFQKALELLEHRLSKETEWQVEILMNICGDKVYAVPEPALDEHGCLILKRIDD